MDLQTYSPAAWMDPVPLIVSFFKSKDALSATNAVSLDNTDLVAMGIYDSLSDKTFSLFPFVKQISGKYYLDEKELKKDIKSPISKLVIVISIIAIGIAVLLLFNVFISLN